MIRLGLTSEDSQRMSEHPVPPDQISALLSFSVGTLEGTDAMLVLGYAPPPEGGVPGPQTLLLAMTPDQARKLAEGLLKAVESASMGQPPSTVIN